MFKDLILSPIYYSQEQNISEEFYVPVMKEAISVSRASAFFSARALSHCAEGFEYFYSNKGKCRLILSQEITEADFLLMKQGNDLRKKYQAGLIENLSEELNLEEEKRMSNLAYLMALGMVEIKIAFMPEGTFHYKFGLYVDKEGNKIASCGSDNFTEAAIEKNAEAFTITCSWQSSEFDFKKITLNEQKFNHLWQNKDSEAVVLELDDIVSARINKYNKNTLIIDKAFLSKNSFILDYRDSLIGYNRIDSKDDANKTLELLRRVYISGYVKSIQNNTFMFKDNISYLTIKKIINVFHERAPKINLKITEALKKYLEEKELYIQERSILGTQIKMRNETIATELEKYKTIIDTIMIRPLKENQLWDSYFMYSMKKASNFSVPGSGKTASVLGVYAYLHSLNTIDRIVVISPINAFQSWIDEFRLCFGNNIPLNYFSIQDDKTTFEKHNILNYDWMGYNLLLFNYESVGSYRNELATIVSKNTLLVLDEVHKVKGISGERASHVLDISKSATRVITMTGTPIPNSYQDIYNNLNILFPDEYNDFFSFSPKFLLRAKKTDMEKINKKINPFFCRTSKEQLMVPKANKDIIKNVDVSDEENQLFQILISKYRRNKFALIVRLLQLESNPQMLLEKIDLEDFENILEENEEIKDLEYIDYSDDVKKLITSVVITSKVKACLKVCKELYSQKKPVIIWTIFKKSIVTLRQELEKIGIPSASISGETSIEERGDIIDSFRAKKIPILITNPHTLAESVSLHMVCHDAIYFEYSYNLVHLLQSKDRIHRLGLPKGQYTQYYFLEDVFNPNTYKYSLDEKIYDRLKYKEDVMLTAISDNQLEILPTPEEDMNEILKKLKL